MGMKSRWVLLSCWMDIGSSSLEMEEGEIWEEWKENALKFLAGSFLVICSIFFVYF